MIEKGKNTIQIAFIFGIYILIVNLFFNTFDFLESRFSFLFYLIFEFSLFPILIFIYLRFFLRSKKEKGVDKILFSFSFIVSGLVGSTITWILFSGPKQHFFIFISSFIIASFLPSLLSILYFLFIETKEKFDQLSSVSLVNGKPVEGEEEKLFRLENANGKILLEVPLKKIICFEANDNYVVTYFLKNDQDIAKSMERISLKKIEEMILPISIPFYRVHKSYLINPLFIDEIKGRAQAYKIKMKHFQNHIPVSRSYDISTLPRF